MNIPEWLSSLWPKTAPMTFMWPQLLWLMVLVPVLVVVYMWLLGRKWCDLTLWCPDLQLMHTVRIHRNDDAIEAWFLAVAQIAPLSLALATFLPVLMRCWTVESSELVEFRFCSAISAPAFVLMLFIAITKGPFQGRPTSF